MRHQCGFAISISMLLISMLLPQLAGAAGNGEFSMAQAMRYPYVSQLAAAERGDAIAWVRNVDGVRNVWLARAPDFQPRQVSGYTTDEGQEITQLTFSPDASRLVFVRGGDHDANWPAEGNLAPDPDSSTATPTVTIWQVSMSGGTSGAPQKVADGDAPAISATGQLAYIKDGQVWSAALDGESKPQRLFFDRGKDGDLQWSPDGRSLAFVSDRGDHAFIGLFTASDKPLRYLAPSTGIDLEPRWSPDGARVAFVRRPGDGGAPEPSLERVPQPWSLWVAQVSDATGHAVWQSPATLAGSYPDVAGEANLHWAAGDRLVFLAYLDDWQHLYSVPANGGSALLLTPGAFMVEHVTQSRDRRSLIYDANTGTAAGDSERRHLFRVPVDRAVPTVITSGQTLDWTPVAATAERVAFVTSSVQEPPAIALVSADGSRRTVLPAKPAPGEFPGKHFVTPRSVTFAAADGLLVHGQIFEGAHSSSRKPAVIFVHGGPPRQMLLGWHYMDYYSNAFVVNQYLAAHGFVVLSVNYRLGIGYGRAYHQPEHWGPTGAAEYQDVVAGAHYLQGLPGVDAKRIGIWGGSYGGYLTALALARNSDIFAAGVDVHGVHDWSLLLDDWIGKPKDRFEKGDREAALGVAWTSSPDSSIGGWKSPVLLIQGDDDRNVPFAQMIDLTRRLDAQRVPHEELVVPNEIHGFLRHSSLLALDAATVEFLERKLQAPHSSP